MKYIILFLSLCIVSTLSAQEHTEIKIRGKLISLNDKGEEEPVPGAKLYWANNDHRAISTPDGSFTIHVDKLPDTLFIRSIGYETTAYLVSDPQQFLTINLTKGQMLSGVTVIGENLGKYIDLKDPFNIEKIGQDELKKAACCNLSESFETNASVDVNITDAISGAKKIQMLGLDGVYTQMQWENIPLVRGLSTSYGLSFTPGTWINSIQITKGTGTVVNGYESMAGIINLTLIQPEAGERLFVNAYLNRFGRAEINLHGAQVLNSKWSTATFVHASNGFMEYDINKDGFRDAPIGFLGAMMHRWAYSGKNYEAKFGFKLTYADKFGGTMQNTFIDEQPIEWNAHFLSRHVEFFGKNGIFFESRPFASLGMIGQAKYHNMENYLGFKKYFGTQTKGYLNTIYSDIIRNTNHNYKTGISFIYDDYVQSYNDSGFYKTEIVPGAFFEYTYNRLDKLILVVGVRGDLHNLYGPLYAPRLHLKWNPDKRTAVRLSTGRGIRVPNPYADYVGMMASNRVWIIFPNILPEDCISSGITFIRKFLTNENISSISLDYFYTHFFNQMIVDMDISPNELHIYNTNAKSFSHAAQAELSVKPLKNIEFRAAFKYYDVRSVYDGELRQRAFVPKYRALFNVGYSTRNKKWMIDVTGNWVGKKRLPSTTSNPLQYQRGLESKDYWILHSQITYNFKSFSIYLGGENLLNVIQKDAIIAADDPYGSFFDATQIWAPISGFNIYGGIRFEIDKKEE